MCDAAAATAACSASAAAAGAAAACQPAAAAAEPTVPAEPVQLPPPSSVYDMGKAEIAAVGEAARHSTP